MARQSINIGTSANKGDGDPLRTAFTKINSNFSELYAGNFVEPTALNSSLIANADGTLSLGSSTNQWQNLYVKDFIYLDGKRISMSAGGALMVNNGIVQVTDVVGSVFADDSKMMMDALTGTLFGPMIGDVTGSLFADDSTVMVDAVGKLFIGNLVGDVTGTVSSIANHSTTDLTEGTNLYYTQARADARVDAGFLAKSTTNLSEGTNLYYTDARADARVQNAIVDSDTMTGATATNIPSAESIKAYVDSQVASKDALSELSGDTDDVTEGTNNLYHTTARVNSAIDTRVDQTFVNSLNITATSFTETDPVVGAITGIVKADGSGNISAAVAGTDYLTTVAFADLTSKPTTIAGYGITDALALGTSSTTALAGDTTFSFADITSKPTTLSGYGITDALPSTSTGNVTLDVNGAGLGISIGNASTSGSTVSIGAEVNNTSVNMNGVTEFNARAIFSRGTHEIFYTFNGQGGVTDHNVMLGHLFYHTGVTSDLTPNLTNFDLTAEDATNITVIINQGATPYEVTALQIGGAAQTINWQGGSQPTGNANGIDSFSFTILNDGGTYVVLGQMVDFT